MIPQLRMMLWKEWRERRVQFLVCLLWMVGGAICTILYESSRGFRAPVGDYFATAFIFGYLAPIFIAMRTALGETTDRTRSFSNSLPISDSLQGWIRWIGGASVMAVPIVIGSAILSLWLAAGWLEQAPTRPTDMNSHYVSLPQRGSLPALSAVAMLGTATAVLVCAVTSLYGILCLVGTFLRRESQLGFFGATVAMLWFLGWGVGVELKQPDYSELGKVLAPIVPGSIVTPHSYGGERGNYQDLSIATAVFGPLLINLALQLLLATLFVRRYGRRHTGHGSAKTFQRPPRIWRPWTMHLPTRGIALVWLTLRQAMPMCLPGFLLALLLTLLEMDHLVNNNGGFNAAAFVDNLPEGAWIVGLLWAVVIGAGTFSAETDSSISEFWRTRPIATWPFFAVKFLVGLAVVLCVLDVATIAVTWRSPNWGEYRSMNWPYIACIVPLHATMFAIAVACTCILRKAALGGMVTMVMFVFFNVIVDWWDVTRPYNPIEVYNNLALPTPSLDKKLDFANYGFPMVATAMGLTMLGSLLVGYLAFRRYDPVRRA
jgi:hypothetical protein